MGYGVICIIMRGRYWPVDFSSAAYRFKITETLLAVRVMVEVESVRPGISAFFPLPDVGLPLNFNGS